MSVHVNTVIVSLTERSVSLLSLIDRSVLLFSLTNRSVLLLSLDRSVCGTGRQKKARLANNLGEKVQHRPGPLDLIHKHILPPENRELTHTRMK